MELPPCQSEALRSRWCTCAWSTRAVYSHCLWSCNRQTFRAHVSAMNSRCRSGTEPVDTAMTSGRVFAEYVWIGGTGSDLHSKTKVLRSRPHSVQDLPVWHFDGLPGSPGLAYLQPRKLVPDPFRGCNHVLVLCDTFCPPRCHGEELASRVHPTNNRFPCAAVLDAARAHDPLFSVEQQYHLLNSDSLWPLGELTASFQRH